jgi:hypothetical protein
MDNEVYIKFGDPGYERLFTAWKADNREAGTLCIGTEQYTVLLGTDDKVFFKSVSGNIDSFYGSLSGGITS